MPSVQRTLRRHGVLQGELELQAIEAHDDSRREGRTSSLTALAKVK